MVGLGIVELCFKIPVGGAINLVKIIIKGKKGIEREQQHPEQGAMRLKTKLLPDKVLWNSD